MSSNESAGSDDAVTLTQNEVYVRFAHDKRARKRYLDDIARAVAKKFVSTSASPLALLRAAGKGAGEQRVLLCGSTRTVTAKLTLTSVTNEGTAIQPYVGSSRGHPVVKVSLTIPEGASRTLVLHRTEPSGTGPPTVRVPPMINPMTVDVMDADCGS